MAFRNFTRTVANYLNSNFEFRKHTSLLIFGLGGYIKASPVGEVLDNESTYVVVGITFDPHVAAVFTSQMTEIHGQGPSMTKANKNATYNIVIRAQLSTL